MTDTMSPQAELSTMFQDTDSAQTESSERSVALIGPNETSRKIVARALAGSDAGFVREFTAYPSKLIEVPRILEQNFNVVMIDVDSDESCALALVEALAAAGTAIVMVYSQRNQPDLMMRCMQAGARDFLPLPADTPAEARPAEPQPRKDAIHVVEPRREAPAAPQAAPVVAAAPKPVPVAPPAPQAKARVEAPPAPRVVAPEPVAPKRVAPEPARAAAAEPAPERAPVTPPTFGMPTESESKPRNKMIWLLAAVPVIGLAVGGSLYFRSEHKAAPEPTAVKYDASAAQPESTPAADGDTTAPAPVATSPIAKPSAAAPAGQTIVVAAPQPRGVTPDAMNAQLTAPSRIGGDLKKPAPQEEAAPAGFAPGAMQSNASLPGGVFAQRSNVQVRPPVEAISAGVAEGMLIRKSPPIYPTIAKDAGVSGTVVIDATITKTGTLRGLRVVSGPPMLASAALEAAKTWRYRPYLLDNQPVEVETTLRIVFNLGQR